MASISHQGHSAPRPSLQGLEVQELPFLHGADHVEDVVQKGIPVGEEIAEIGKVTLLPDYGGRKVIWSSASSEESAACALFITLGLPDVRKHEIALFAIPQGIESNMTARTQPT